MTKVDIIKKALKTLVKNELQHCGNREGCGFEDNDENTVTWQECLEWLESQPCEDAISREEALRVFARKADAINPYSEAWEAVRALPSVQPHSSENLTSCEDCISREAVLKMKMAFRDEDGVMAYAVPTGNILRLPSVQPQIQTSEDCISRKAVIKAVDKHTLDDNTLDDDISVILEKVPSVQPHRPKGKWINQTVRGSSVPCCSVCGSDSGTDYYYSYCPNCGCEMEVEK